MAVREVTTVSGTCDLCHVELDTEQSYVDAMTYGAAFHLDCLGTDAAFTPLDVMRALGLDDITHIFGGKRQKLIYNFT